MTSTNFSVDDEKASDSRRTSKADKVSCRKTSVDKDFLDDEDQYENGNEMDYWTGNVLDPDSIRQLIYESGDSLWDADLIKRQKEWVDLLLLANDVGLPTDPEAVNLHKGKCMHLPSVCGHDVCPTASS